MNYCKNCKFIGGDIGTRNKDQHCLHETYKRKEVRDPVDGSKKYALAGGLVSSHQYPRCCVVKIGNCKLYEEA